MSQNDRCFEKLWILFEDGKPRGCYRAKGAADYHVAKKPASRRIELYQRVETIAPEPPEPRPIAPRAANTIVIKVAKV